MKIHYSIGHPAEFTPDRPMPDMPEMIHNSYFIFLNVIFRSQLNVSILE